MTFVLGVMFVVNVLTLGLVLYLALSRAQLAGEFRRFQAERDREATEHLRQVEADRDVLREIVYRGQGSQQVQATAVQSLADAVAQILAKRSVP